MRLSAAGSVGLRAKQPGVIAHNSPIWTVTCRNGRLIQFVAVILPAGVWVRREFGAGRVAWTLEWVRSPNARAT